MKGVPTKLGAQPKQLAILGALVVILGVVYWINRTSSPPASAAASRAESLAIKEPSSPLASRTAPPVPAPAQRTERGGTRAIEDFRPSLKPKEGTDISRVDPTLRTDLLAKIRSAPMGGGSRSIFEFSQPPAPPPPKVDPIKPGPPVVAVAKPASPDPEAKPATTPPPPIPLKFYGYGNTPRSGPKRAFFLEGEDIFVAGENELVHNRYKIVRIGVNSAVVEDTTNKNQQTLPLVEEQPG